MRIFNHLNILRIEDEIIATKDMRLIAILGAYTLNFETKSRVEDILFSSKDYKNIYLYGTLIKNNPCINVVNVLMDDEHGENYEYVYNLTKMYYKYPSFNLRRVERYFAKNHVEGIFGKDKLENLYLEVLEKSYDEFIDSLIGVCNGWELCNYAVHNHSKLSDINLKKIEDKLIECHEPNVLCTFAFKVPGCDFDKIEDEIINSKRSKYMYEFAKHVKSSNRHRLLGEIIKQGDLIYIYKFENNINNVVREDIMNQILQSKDPKMICALASELGAKYLKECEEALKLANDEEYLEYFYKNNSNRM